MSTILPISAIVPTMNRADILARMLQSLAQQSAQPAEMVIVDASQESETEKLCGKTFPDLETRLVYRRAKQVGAAAQRNEAVEHASQSVVMFLDDDILFEPDCVLRLWQALESDNAIGGVNAMITNQRYLSPGSLSRLLFRSLHGRREASYAGKCIGPALNLLPEDREDLPEVVPVEWLNLGCTAYRIESLPSPVFAEHFSGYSFMEDVALSLTVGKKWKLANARTARIYHDSQPANYKSDQSEMAKMALVNRHFIMTQILGRKSVVDHLKLALLESFGITTSLRSAKAWRALPSVLIGKAKALRIIIRSPRKNADAAALPENGKRVASSTVAR